MQNDSDSVLREADSFYKNKSDQFKETAVTKVICRPSVIIRFDPEIHRVPAGNAPDSRADDAIAEKFNGYDTQNIVHDVMAPPQHRKAGNHPSQLIKHRRKKTELFSVP